MTKKNYELIARVLHESIRVGGEQQIAYDLADAFAEENPRFNTARFLKACGLDETA